MVCIYCSEDKPATAFSGREHVIPQAFGLFSGKNLTLKCVCDDYNKVFGDGIDRKIARDSIEGFDRVAAGLKPASSLKTLGARSTSRVEFMEGAMRGAVGHLTSARAGESRLGATPLPQVHFAKSADGPFETFLAYEVPKKDELIALGYARGSKVFIRTHGIKDATAFLASKGIAMELADVTEGVPPDGVVRLEHVTQVSEPEFRVMAKIVMNYFAAVLGSAPARRPELGNLAASAQPECFRDQVRTDAAMETVALSARDKWSAVPRVFNDRTR